MTELDYDGYGEETETSTETCSLVGSILGNGDDAVAINKALHKVLTDPELSEIYEQARREAQQPEYNREVVPALLKVRREYNDLIDNWPRNVPAGETSARLAEMKAEERRLLSEFRGARKVGEIEPLLWLAKKVWPDGADARCPKCSKGRHVEVEELTRWLRRGVPDCGRCGVEVALTT